MVRRRQPAVLLLLPLLISGCNSYQRAETVHRVVASILAIAGAEVSQFPQNEQPIISGFVSAGTSINNAYGSCIDNANQAMLNKSTKFLDCLGIFSKALNDPQLLAQLRILNPKSASRVQLWVTAVSIAVNEALIWFGSQGTPPPAVGSTPTAVELQEFRVQVVRGM